MAPRGLHRTAPVKIKKAAPPSLKDRLLSQPYRFEFAQAIYLMHRMVPHQTSVGEGSALLNEPVFLKSRVFLSAPPSDLHSVAALSTHPKTSLGMSFQHIQDEDGPQRGSSPLKRLEVNVNFFGIAGVQGPLPTPYTEMILARVRQKDHVLGDFLNLFNHRLLSLTYRVAQYNRPSLQLVSPEKTLRGSILFHLMGLCEVPPLPGLSVGDLLGYARFFWKKPRTPLMLGLIVRRYFGCVTDIKGFEGRFIPLGETNEMRLAAHGGRNTGLGTGAVLGRQVWCQDRGIRVCLTLTCPEELRKFLPSYENFKALKSLIEAYVGVRSTYRISLTLLHKPPSYLQGPQASLPLRLGWTTWLLSKSSSLPTQEVVFGPHITARV